MRSMPMHLIYSLMMLCPKYAIMGLGGDESVALSKLSPYVRVALDYTIPSYWPFRERVIFDYGSMLQFRTVS